jgi:hypothetical protein
MCGQHRHSDMVRHRIMSRKSGRRLAGITTGMAMITAAGMAMAVGMAATDNR